MPSLCQPHGPSVGSQRTERFFGFALVWTITIAVIVSWKSPVYAQRFRWQDDDFEYRRSITLPPGMQTMPEVIIAEFFSHGALKPGAGEVVVYSSKDPVPRKVFQLGPGDFARIAFEAVAGESRYYLYYGGRPAAKPVMPEWTSTSGLFFETRRWQDCDVNSLESVQKAYADSTRIGSDLVGGVFHRHNPFAAKQGPFLSRYAGVLNIPTTGEYGFYTSSQDCSFLLIDGNQVVAAPGEHPPETRATTKGVLKLTAGPHSFEYLHAAKGEETCMVAAWQIPGLGDPAKISPEMFRFDRVLRVPPVQLEHRDKGFLPDYRMAILGDIPSSEPDTPAMVRTQFVDASPQPVTANAKYQWDFGDGQTSEFNNPGHVFLHPGAYRVALTLKRGGKEPMISNQIYVTRQFIVDSKGQEAQDLTAYVETLENYNSTNLDAVGLVQLVKAYVLADDPVNATQAALAAFAASDTGHTDKTRWMIAGMVGPLLRDRLDNPKAAAKLWTDATALIKTESLRAASATNAADILLNDLLLRADAKNALTFAEQNLGDATPITRSRYYRVLGDWYVRGGNKSESLSSYLKADASRQLEFDSIEQTARRGARQPVDRRLSAQQRSCSRQTRVGPVADRFPRRQNGRLSVAAASSLSAYAREVSASDGDRE